MTQPRLAPVAQFRPELLFRPDTLAVVGDTPVASEVLANIRAGGFPGTVLEASDAAAVADLPLAPDLAVVASAPAEVAAALAALGARGTRAAVVPGLAPDLGAAARAAGVRVYGPGSFGIAVPALGLNATRGHFAPPAGRVALVSQSAALCRAVLDWAGPNGVGFSHVIGVGGNADLGFAAALDWLAADPGTGLVLLDIRRIRNPRAFLSAARACARLRPVVAIRAGGRLFDVAGAAEATFAAALRRAGVLSVATLEDLLAATETLTRAAPLRREGLAIVTNAVGPGQLAADAALREGIALAGLSAAGRAALEEVLPEGAAGPGPVYAGLAPPLRLAEAAAMLAGAPEVGVVLAVHAPVGGHDAATIAALAAGAPALRVPLLVCAMGESTGAAHRRTLAEAGRAGVRLPRGRGARRASPAGTAPCPRGGARAAGCRGAGAGARPPRGAHDPRSGACRRAAGDRGRRDAGGARCLWAAGGARPGGADAAGCGRRGPDAGLPGRGEAAP